MVKKESKLFKVFFYTINIFFLSTIHVQAYIDPSVMTYAIQAIAGIAIAIGTFLNVYWRRIRRKAGLDGLFSRGNKENESEKLIFNDPVTGETISALSSADEARESDEKSFVKTKTNEFRSFWNEYKYCLLMAVALCFMVLIFSPLDLYLNNKLDFWFDFKTIIIVLIKFFGAAVFAGLAVFAVCYLLFDELYHVAYVFCFILFLCLYVQGNFFAGALPPIDGTAIDWTVYSAQRIESLVIWIGIPVLVFLILKVVKLKAFYKITASINAAILVMLSVSLIVVGIKNNAFKSKVYRVPTTENLFQMSDNQNVIIFLVDALDARVFSDVLERQPEYKEDFKNFTYFPNSVAAYTFTSYALPQMLTGTWYENETDYQTYFTEAMDEAPIYKKLKDEGYDMGMYETNLVYESDNILKFNNFKDVEVGFTDRIKLMREEFKLFVYKYAPYQLKKYAEPNLYAFFGTQAIIDDAELFSDINPKFYKNITESNITTTHNKCFKFIHIEGAHVPFRYNQNVEEIDESEGSYEQNVLCSITIMKAYLEKLKTAGTYDNTAIVMLGDHGFNYDNNEYWGRQNPVLMVKGVAENHDFAVSQAPISYDDLQEAYSRLCDGKKSVECFDAKEGDKRHRRFMHFIREAKITEYSQTGYASDTKTLLPTGKVYERDVNYIAEFHTN